MEEAGNIIQTLKAEIDSFDAATTETTVGTVVEVKDGIARLSGLSSVKMSEMLDFGDGLMGVALNLEEDGVGAMILGDFSSVKEGDTVQSTGNLLSVPVSREVIGRIVDGLGKPLDDKGAIKEDKRMPVEKVAPGVITRKSVHQPVQTGLKAIDSLIPIGRGQRELIIGDRQTGKTAVAIDTIINQKGKDMICIYVAIGQKESKTAKIVAEFEKHGAMEYTIVVDAGAAAPAAMQYIAPYAGTAIGEYFMEQGKDVLVIFDDLSKQAWAYRQISLILRRPPGREAYPGDIFYAHSRLLERACKLNEDHGGGSITALPIIETQAGDVSAYIPTNVISITDGQIFLESSLFNQGIRPALNVGLSVSRVGSSAQKKSMKKVAGKIRLELAQYRELAAFAQFGADLDEDTKQRLDRGARITEILKQSQYEPVSVAHQVSVIYGVTNGHFDGFELEELQEKEEKMRTYLDAQAGTLMTQLEAGEWDDKIEGELKTALEQFIATQEIKK